MKFRALIQRDTLRHSADEKPLRKLPVLAGFAELVHQLVQRRKALIVRPVVGVIEGILAPVNVLHRLAEREAGLEIGYLGGMVYYDLIVYLWPYFLCAVENVHAPAVVVIQPLDIADIRVMH